MVLVAGSALTRQLVILRQEGRQAQFLEMMAKQNLWSVAHGPPLSRLM